MTCADCSLQFDWTIHVDDKGTVFTVTLRKTSDPASDVVDLTDADTLTVKLKPPKGLDLVELVGAVLTPATDGKFTFTSDAGTFSVAGAWEIQVELTTTTGGSWSSDVAGFQVKHNLT